MASSRRALVHRGNPSVSDVGLAAAAVLVDVLVFTSATTTAPGAAAYLVLGVVLLAFRRRAPFAVCAAICAHALLPLWLPGATYNPSLVLLLALFTVSAHSASALRARTAFLLVLGVNALYAAREAVGIHRGAFVVILTVYLFLDIAAWTAGRWVQERRGRQATEQALTAERTRVAGELHDIVAHSVTVMLLQNAVARSLLDRAPDRAAQALADVDAQGRQAMNELRRMLTALRDGDDPRTPTQAPDTSHGLRDVPALVAGLARTGLTVELQPGADVPPLDPSVDLAAYRIVQEGLTNAARYAGRGATAVVRWTWAGGDELDLEVRDDGRGRRDPATAGLSTGSGLLGLQERVTVIGGRLSAGSTPDGGFALVAHLPVTAHVDADAASSSLVRGA